MKILIIIDFINKNDNQKNNSSYNNDNSNVYSSSYNNNNDNDNYNHNNDNDTTTNTTILYYTTNKRSNRSMQVSTSRQPTNRPTDRGAIGKLNFR